MAEISIPRLGYGAATLGNLHRERSDEECLAVLEAAWEHGVRLFDTAPHYGLGLSERRLGAFLRTKPRDEYLVSTKVGRLIRPNPEATGRRHDDFAVSDEATRVWDASEEGIRASHAESLERLGLDRVDILYLHDPEQYGLEAALATGLPTLVRLREEGTVKAIGVGSMAVATLDAAVGTGLVDLLMVAGRYTLVDHPVVPRVTAACAERGVGIVAASVFNSGLLATDDPGGDDRFDYGAVPEEMLERARRIAALAREGGARLPELALQYPLRDPVVRTVVIGADTPEQVDRDLAGAAAAIPSELWRRLEDEELIPR